MIVSFEERNITTLFHTNEDFQCVFVCIGFIKSSRQKKTCAKAVRIFHSNSMSLALRLLHRCEEKEMRVSIDVGSCMIENYMYIIRK